jgi:thiosulfate/3-mercaptopyruvate sulfurtransferase
LRLRTGLIAAYELASRVGDIGKDLVFIDMREGAPLPKVPGSVWFDLHDGFAQHRPGRGLDYDLPSPEEFAATLSRAGATPDSAIILADDAGNRRATRAYWLLRYYGHRGPVSVLDGGLLAYARQDLPTVAEFARPAPGHYPVPTTTDESIRATPTEILQGIEEDRVVICDVRTAEEYHGEFALSGRGGHLPQAQHVPWEESLNPDGTFRSNDELEQVLRPFISEGHQAITYCQGGIRASLTWFALHVLLGRPSKLYAASWEEWAQRQELPVEMAG